MDKNLKYFIGSIVTLLIVCVFNIFVMLINLSMGNIAGVVLNSLLWLYLGFSFGVFWKYYRNSKKNI